MTIDRRKYMALTGRARQGGFIVTLELLLILTILGIGLLVGFVAVRDALVKRYVSQLSQQITVSDSNGTLLGKAVDFDEHEAPRIFYIDRSGGSNYRALIGVRDDRFTSREPVYYTELNCQGDPCIKPPSNEVMDNRGIEQLPATGAVSYLYGLQGQPTYAIGRSADGIRGNLYRQSPQACPVDTLTGAIGSRYLSQKVVSGSPCESPLALPLPVGEAPVYCPELVNGVGACPANCSTGSGGSLRGEPNDCGCPAGYFDAGALVGLVEGTCCPEGYDLQTGLDGALCRGPGLSLAVEVADPSDASRNALDGLTPPFSVNLPVDAANSSWQPVAADGEGGPDF